MIKKVEPGPGQESVWDYPRPPQIRACEKNVRIILGGEVLADTMNAICVLETSHPPVYYLPPADINMSLLEPGNHHSYCEWKGIADYYNIKTSELLLENAAWSYGNPMQGYTALKDHVAFYARLMDACYVGDEEVRPQPGGFYGGWITSGLVGPFKGEPGTGHW